MFQWLFFWRYFIHNCAVIWYFSWNLTTIKTLEKKGKLHKWNNSEDYIPLEPRTADNSPPCTSNETSLSMTPVRTVPIIFWMQVPASTWPEWKTFDNSKMYSLVIILSIFCNLRKKWKFEKHDGNFLLDLKLWKLFPFRSMESFHFWNLNNYFDFHVCLSIHPSVRLSMRGSVCYIGMFY